MIALPFTTIGPLVKLPSPATAVSHSGAPVRMSMATRCLSEVATSTLSSWMAIIRLMPGAASLGRARL